jgi:hypothetical protein
MKTMGWFFILISVLILRGIKNGRVKELPDDMKDTFIAGMTGDFNALSEISNRKGEGLSVPDFNLYSIEFGGNPNNNLIGEMKRLANQAGNKYVWGGESLSEGGYDCSGLVWAALKSMGKYNGSRFTAGNFPSVASKFSEKVNSPQPGDIVRWPDHIGVVTGTDRYYSALNRNAGIKEDAIHNHKGTPTYYRVK